MIKELINKLFKRDRFGISFDKSVKINKIPEEDFSKRKSAFYNLNKDLGIFEITDIEFKNKKSNLIHICEVGTENEFVIEQKLFEFLFTNVPIPKEIEF